MVLIFKDITLKLGSSASEQRRTKYRDGYDSGGMCHRNPQVDESLSVLRNLGRLIRRHSGYLIILEIYRILLDQEWAAWGPRQEEEIILEEA